LSRIHLHKLMRISLTMQTTGPTEPKRDARVYRRDRGSYAEQTEWHERRFGAA
jgi:hypothetical protein